MIQHEEHLAKDALKQLRPGDDLPGIIDRMFRHHNEMLNLCSGLESLADSLPDEVDPANCKTCADTVEPLLVSCHGFEEDILFPKLCSLMVGDRVVRMRIERLVDEHREDEMFAEEVAEVLGDWARAGGRWGSNMTGYMLRGFFVGLRRHVATEQTIVASVLRLNAGA